jgi:hypothetical protein
MTDRLTAAEAARGPYTDKWQYRGHHVPVWRNAASSPRMNSRNDGASDAVQFSEAGFPVRLVPLENPSPTKETP